jgi:hypothetical protein
MLTILTASDFKKMRREKLLDYALYADEAADLSMRISRTTKRMEDAEFLREKTAAELMRMTRGRAEYAIDFLTLSYSAGTSVEDMREFYPSILHYWEEFAKYDKSYDDSPESQGAQVAHFGLKGDDFEMVNRMVCFGILLGWTEFLPRVAALLDYRNSEMDGMLERLFQNFVPDRAAPPDECNRHLPYFKTLKIFSAGPENRTLLMQQYLQEWYHASRREPYYDSHKGGASFMGYWSWEAAAITFLLNIEDVTYRDAGFYPSDLVAYARSNRTALLNEEGLHGASGELRAKSGEVCPVSGLWETLDPPVQQKIFEKGEVIIDFESAYGLTVWIFKGNT